MKRIFVALLSTALCGHALAASADSLHVKAAFAFEHKKMWGMAIGEAKAAHDAVLLKFFTWEYLKDPTSGATFDEITAFIEKNPRWPDQQALLKRAEVALMAGNPSDETLSAWFADHPPQTSMARMRKAGSTEMLNAMIRQAWVTDDYDKDTEARLLAKYHGVLRAQDHILRIDRLLWEGHNEEAKRLMKYVPYDHQRLFLARMYLAEDKEQAPIEVVNVAPALRSDPGLIYNRILWRVRRGDKDGVRELLLSTPNDVPYPEKWWPQRDRQIREVLAEGNVKLAARLLARHGQKEDSSPYKEVQWLSGWIALEYMHQPEKAYANFSWLYKNVQAPGSKSRAAYWAGRAAANREDEHKWFSNAAAYPTTFYGQIAAAQLGDHPTLTLRSDAEPTSEEKSRFRKREMVQLVYALGAAHETDTAIKFILHLVENSESSGEAILATRLGKEIDRTDLGVRAAKRALQNDVLSLQSGWPVFHVSRAGGLETPLLLGISRQESEFYADAVSPSGAIGVMQLLPGTAKEVARKNDIRYVSDKLYTPDYNMMLGGLYLGRMVEKFGGSYILGIASYNAGPGRIGQWISQYGKPDGSVEGALDWIERIPLSETRNYVQHVLENVQVYRFLIAGKDSIPLRIEEDLQR